MAPWKPWRLARVEMFHSALEKMKPQIESVLAPGRR